MQIRRACLQVLGLLCILCVCVCLNDLPTIGHGQEGNEKKSIERVDNTPSEKKTKGKNRKKLRDEIEQINKVLEQLQEKLGEDFRKQPIEPQTQKSDQTLFTANLTRLEGHLVTPSCAAISPDGKFAASGDREGAIFVWDLATRKTIVALKVMRKTKAIRSIAFSYDGNLLAVATDSGSDFFRRIERGTFQVDHSTGGLGFGGLIAFAPNNSGYLTGSGQTISHVLRKAVSPQKFETKMDFCRSLGFSADGQLGICAGGFLGNSATAMDANVRVWDLHSNQLVFRIQAPHRTSYLGAVITPDNKQVLSVGPNGLITAWSMENGRELLTFEKSAAQSIAISIDGERAASRNYDSVDIWDVTAGSRLLSVPLAGSAANAPIVFSRDSRTILATGADAHLYMLTVPVSLVSKKAVDIASQALVVLEPQGEIRRFEGHSYAVYSIAVSPDGKSVYSSSFDGTLRKWDLATGKELAKRAGSRGWDIINHIAVSPDGRRAVLAAGTTIGTQMIILWDLVDWKEIAQWSGHERVVLGAAISPDNLMAATAGMDGVAKVWDLQTRHEVLRLGSHIGPVVSVTYSGDGQRIATGASDGSVRIWDASDGKELLKLKTLGNVNGIAFSPDGTKIATSAARTCLWDATTGELLVTWQLDSQVHSNSICFSPNGQQTIAGCSDGSIRGWSIGNDTELYRIEGHKDNVTQAIFTPDGDNILSSSCDYSVRLWNTPEPIQ